MINLSSPTRIQDIPKCKTCKYCNTTTTGQDVWIKHYCELHKQDVTWDTTCLNHKISQSYNGVLDANPLAFAGGVKPLDGLPLKVLKETAKRMLSDKPTKFPKK